MNNKFLVDCDDTIARLAIPLQNALNMATNKSYYWKNWTGCNLEEIYDISSEQFIEIMIEGRVLEQALPIAGMQEALERMSDQGYAIRVCTKRSWHPQAMELTKSWFDDFNLTYDSIDIIGLNESKADIMKKWNSECLIDDQLHNCQAAYTHGYDSYLIRMPWHEQVTGFKTVNHLNEIFI